MRGYGDSDKPSGNDGYDAHSLAEEFRALVQQIGFVKGKSRSLVAHDMGAPPALLWAANHPDEICGLVYMECPVMLENVFDQVCFRVRVLMISITRRNALQTLGIAAAAFAYADTHARSAAQPSHTGGSTMFENTPEYPPLPADDLQRNLTIAEPNTDQTLVHIGVVGDTYTLTVSGNETNGRFCVFDMLVPPGGGPGPHRHDFEETFILLDGELEATFRGKKSIVRAGDTVNIPSNAPHQFHNASSKPARFLCICSPAGQEDFFKQIGVLLPTRTTPPPKLDKEQQAEFMKKAQALAPRYRTELLKEA